MASRPITADEIGYAAEVVELAFREDPVWSVALRAPDGRTDHHAGWWRPAVEGPFRYGTVRTSEDRGAIAIWLPPGGVENTPQQVAELDALARRVLSPASAAAMHELLDRFEAARAPRPPHYYLGILATHPDHRGRGVGQRLLAEDLALWDVEGVPAYLESTNPANDHRYHRLGFVTDGGFTAPIDGAPISTMWRPVRGVLPA
jgi:GNAT superfamily N-acetyltransferase